ncbi:MAG: hypothetical protein H0V94_03685 [Actinobacteria bacterium]|nr:hypothetical protein [Actinomycetota bacterium]
MRTLATLVTLFLLFSGWQYLRRHSNENRLASVATELTQRDVDVGCPGFFARLVEITPYGGWVNFDEHGRPADETFLSAGTCRNLERLWRADDPSFGCLVSRSCSRDKLAQIDGMVTLAHESWHLRGVTNEAQTQCYAVQSVERTALLLGISAVDSRLVADWVAISDAAAPRDDYHASECRPGGSFDLAPETSTWPSA